MPLRIVRNDITQMNTDAIVNTANRHVAVGDGCDRAIYTAAGYDRLIEARREIGEMEEGEVCITPGFDLPAKYIIHAVSPLYISENDETVEKLRKCYRSGLELAESKGLASIAFPLISTGSFGFPREEGMRIAVDEINAFLLKNSMLVYLVVFDEQSTGLGRKLDNDLEAYIDSKYVEEKLGDEYRAFAAEAIFPCDTSMPGGSRPGISAPDGSRPGMPVTPMPSMQRTAAPMPAEEPNASAVRQSRGIFGKAQALIAPKPKKDSALPQKESIFSPKSGIESQKESCLPEERNYAVSFDAVEDACVEPLAAVWSDLSDESKEEALESGIGERMRHLSDTFSEYLLFLIQNKGLENADVYKKAIVDKKVFSKIKNNPEYHPQKITALCLCVGAGLNLDETKDLLARAGYALSPCDKTDIIFAYFIENGIYDMIEIDIKLEEHGLPCVIA